MKKTISLQLHIDLLERLKNAVYWTPGLSMREVMESGIKYSLEQLEKENDGIFPKRLGEVTVGRKMK